MPQDTEIKESTDMEYNLFIVYALITRVISVLLLLAFVLPLQWVELNRQWNQRGIFNGEYWRLALTLILIVLLTIAFSIVPISYQYTRLESPNELNLQNWSSFFTNTIILLQSIGWVLIYRIKR